MSGIEALVEPEPMAKASEELLAEFATEEGYSYQRADGTVEHAMSVEDAISRCPVLGSWQ